MKKTKTRPLLIPLFVLGLIALIFQLTHSLDKVDNRVGDFFLQLNAKNRTPPADIVLITIDQKSLETMEAEAGSWPWPRAIHAELISNLERYQPTAIGFDILFNEADNFRADSDALLRSTAQQYGNLFFPSLLLVDGKPAPLAQLPASFSARFTADEKNSTKITENKNARAPLLVPQILSQKNWQGGLINFEADSDGTGRHARTVTRIEGWELPSFSAAITEFTQKKSAEKNPAQKNNEKKPAAFPDRIRLQWYGTPPRLISYSDLFIDLASEHPKIAPTLRHSIVIVGDSITDGVGSTEDTNRRWPDALAARLQDDPALASIAVVNAGISGNRILNDAHGPHFMGPSVLSRFDRDALSKPGVRWILLMAGINDISAAGLLPPPRIRFRPKKSSTASRG